MFAEVRDARFAPEERDVVDGGVEHGEHPGADRVLDAEGGRREAEARERPPRDRREGIPGGVAVEGRPVSRREIALGREFRVREDQLFG